MPTEELRTILSHVVTDLNKVKNAEKVYSSLRNTTRQLIQTTDKLGRVTSVVKFGGTTKEGQKLEGVVRSLDGQFKNFKSTVSDSEKSTRQAARSFTSFKDEVKSTETVFSTFGKVQKSTTTTLDDMGRVLKTVKFSGINDEGKKVVTTLQGVDNKVKSSRTSIADMAKASDRAARTLPNFNTEVQKTSTAFSNFKNVQKGVTTSLDATGRKLETFRFSGINNEGKRVVTTLKAVNGQFKNSQTQVSTLAKQVDRAGRSYSRFNNILGITGGVIIGSIVSRATQGLVNAFRDSADEASLFLLKIAEIQTISQRARSSTEEWSAALRALADSYGTSVTEQAAAAYAALSDQMAEGIEVTQFLAEANKLAAITVSSVDDASAALSGTLNAYNLTTAHAADVSRAFFKAVDLGRIQLEEVAQTMGRVTILGSQLGITYDELFAALATLTIQGVDAAEGMTFLRNLLLKLIRPTEKMQEIFEEWGVDTGSMAIATLSFEGVLKKLSERAAQSTDPLDEMSESFNRVRATLGAAGIALEDTFAKFDKNLNEIRNASDETSKAFDEISDNSGKKFRKEMERIKNFFVEELGTKFVEGVVDFSEAIGGLSNALQGFSKIGFTALNLGAFGFLKNQVQAAGQAVQDMGLKLKDARDPLSKITNAHKRAAEAARRQAAQSALLGEVIDIGLSIASTKIFNTYANAFKSIDIFQNKFTSLFQEGSAERVKIINEETVRVLKAIDQQTTKMEQRLNQSIATLKSTLNKLSSIAADQVKLDDFLFELEFDILVDEGRNIRAAKLLETRVNKLIQDVRNQIARAAVEGPTAGQREDLLEQIKLINTLADRFTSLGDLKVRLPEGLTNATAFFKGVVLDLGRDIKTVFEEPFGDVKNIATAESQEILKTYTGAVDKARSELAKSNDALQKELQTSAQETSTEIGKSSVELGSAFETLKQQFGNAGTAIASFFANTKNFFGAIEQSADSPDAAFIRLVAGIRGIVVNLKEAENLKPEKLKGLLETIKTLRVDAEQAQEFNFLPIPENIDQIFADLELRTQRLLELSNKAKSIQEISARVESDTNKRVQEALTAADNLDSKFAELLPTLKDLGGEGINTRNAAANAALEILKLLNAEVANLKRESQALRAELILLKATARSTGGLERPIGREQLAFGGTIKRRQGGGSVGKDSVLARFDPNEFIVNGWNKKTAEKLDW